jgi:hypothetical protein
MEEKKSIPEIPLELALKIRDTEMRRLQHDNKIQELTIGAMQLLTKRNELVAQVTALYAEADKIAGEGFAVNRDTLKCVPAVKRPAPSRPPDAAVAAMLGKLEKQLATPEAVEVPAPVPFEPTGGSVNGDAHLGGVDS